jgi:hypothetical protein
MHVNEYYGYKINEMKITFRLVFIGAGNKLQLLGSSRQFEEDDPVTPN